MTARQAARGAAESISLKAVSGSPFKTAYTIAAYSATPVFLGGAFLAFPQVWWLSLVGLAYALWLLWTGIGTASRGRTVGRRVRDFASILLWTAGTCVLVFTLAGVVVLLVFIGHDIHHLQEPVRKTVMPPMPWGGG
jgi:hypothetical protein